MRRTGTTLIELIVSIAILGLLGGIATLAVGTLTTRDVPRETQAISAAQREAVRRGTPIGLTLIQRGSAVALLFLPDGRMLTSDTLSPIELP